MKKALVLGGGVARGAYQCGVWQSLKENNVKFDLVAGTSVGALNGALYIQNKYKECLDIWENLHIDNIVNSGVNLDFDLELLMSQKDKFLPMLQKAVKEKGMDTAPLFDLITRLCDAKKIKKSNMDFFVVTVEVPNLMPYQIDIKAQNDERIADYLMASASCFPAFPLKVIDDKKYVDGGYFDNLPINTALEQGADEILAVNLRAPGIIRKPRQNNKKITIIESYWNLGAPLNFDAETAKRNIVLGYFDTQKILGKWHGYAYTFKTQESLLTKLTSLIEEEIIKVSSHKVQKLIHGIKFELSDNDVELMRKNRNMPSKEDFTLRLLERLMELSDYSPTNAYKVKTVVQEIKESIVSIEKTSAKAWLKKLAKKPTLTIKEFDLKNLIFSVARELDDLDCDAVCLFYKLFPSECLMGILINCLGKL